MKLTIEFYRDDGLPNPAARPSRTRYGSMFINDRVAGMPDLTREGLGKLIVYNITRHLAEPRACVDITVED